MDPITAQATDPETAPALNPEPPGTVWAWLKRTVVHTLANAPESVKGWLDIKELTRSVMTSVGAAGGTGLFAAIVTAIVRDASEIFPNAALASLAIGWGSLILGSYHRASSGKEGVKVVPLADLPSTSDPVAIVTDGGDIPVIVVPAEDC